MANEKNLRENSFDVSFSDKYLDYRIAARAVNERVLNKKASGEKAGNKIERTVAAVKALGRYEELKAKAEIEISILFEHCIVPIYTKQAGNIFNCPGLPKFLHFYNPGNTVDFSSLRPAEILFFTSSRYRDAKIYKPSEILLNQFFDFFYDRKFRFACAGLNSSAELISIERFNPAMLLLLPHTPFFKPPISPVSAKFGKFEPAYKNIAQISAIDPFSSPGKYDFAVRNSLAFCISGEIALFYLSPKGSLSRIVEKFKKAAKEVNIFESDESRFHHFDNIEIENVSRRDESESSKEVKNFILKVLNKGVDSDIFKPIGLDINAGHANITIDKLIKLSNINLNAEREEVLRNISVLEMESKIERVPGGIIRSIKK